MSFSPEVAEILERVRTGAEKPKRVKKVVVKREVVVPKFDGAHVNRVYDYDLIVAMYGLLNSVQDVAEYIGCSRSTVRVALDEAEIPHDVRRSNMKPQEMCKRGLHNLDEHAVQLKNGYRTCGPCMRKNSIERSQRRRDRLKAEAAAKV